MKKLIGILGGLVMATSVCVAGVQTDKIVFGDNTVQTTAGGSSTPPATNTTTVVFDHGYEVRNGELSVSLATNDAAIVATNSFGTMKVLNPVNGLGLRLEVGGGLNWLVDLGSPGGSFNAPFYVANGAQSLSVKIGDGSNANVPGGKAAIDTWGPVFIRAFNDGAALIVTNETKSANAHIGGNAVIAGRAGDFVFEGGNQANGRGMFATYAPWTWEAAFASPGHSSGAAGYVSDGTRTVEFADGTYAVDVTAGNTRLGDIYEASGLKWASPASFALYWPNGNTFMNLVHGMSWDQVNIFNAAGQQLVFAGTMGNGDPVHELYVAGDKRIDIDGYYLDAGGNAPSVYWGGTNGGLCRDVVSPGGGNNSLHFSDQILYDDSQIWRSEGTATNGLQIVNYQTATNLIASPVSDVSLDHDLIHPMSDAAGTGVDWHYWTAGAAVTNEGSWRMGVLNSNFVVQVRMSGAWTNATVFMRP